MHHNINELVLLGFHSGSHSQTPPHSYPTTGNWKNPLTCNNITVGSDHNIPVVSCCITLLTNSQYSLSLNNDFHAPKLIKKIFFYEKIYH